MSSRDSVMHCVSVALIVGVSQAAVAHHSTAMFEPEKRVTMQRGSSVVSGTLSGRSLAVMLGVTNPLLIAAGLAWGLFAASRITPSRAQTAPSNPFAGGVGVTVAPAVIGADGTIVRTSDPLVCVDSDLEAPTATAHAPNYAAAPSD